MDKWSAVIPRIPRESSKARRLGRHRRQITYTWECRLLSPGPPAPEALKQKIGSPPVYLSPLCTSNYLSPSCALPDDAFFQQFLASWQTSRRSCVSTSLSSPLPRHLVPPRMMAKEVSSTHDALSTSSSLCLQARLARTTLSQMAVHSPADLRGRRLPHLHGQPWMSDSKFFHFSSLVSGDDMPCRAAAVTKPVLETLPHALLTPAMPSCQQERRSGRGQGVSLCQAPPGGPGMGAGNGQAGGAEMAPGDPPPQSGSLESLRTRA